MANGLLSSVPSVRFTETDNTFTSANFGLTSLGLVGEFKKGRAFTPIFINGYGLFQQCFGGLDPCKFEGTSQPIYEGSYIARQFLEESNEMFVTRVLGLSGYDAGDAWGITVGGALDANTITDTFTENFSALVRYSNGIVTNVLFSNQKLTELYECGAIPDTLFGDGSLTTGDTISLGNTFIGDCETFSGARFNMDVTDRNENFICISGESVLSTEVLVTTETQDCVVEYSGGTVTYDSKFVITVVNPIVLQNITTGELTIIPSGILTIQGGTITHDTDVSIEAVDSTIFLPNKNVLSGNYKICNLENNDAVYDCDTIDGINFVVTTGTTIITTPVMSGITQSTVAKIPSGIVDLTFTGVVTEISGLPLEMYDNQLIALFRSFANYDSDEILNFAVKGNVMTIESKDGNIIKPTDDFIIKFRDMQDEVYSFDVSLDRTKSNYIRRVFGQFIPCCPPSTPIYIEEAYENTFEYLIDNGLIHCIKPTVCYSQSLNNFKTEYKGAKTPWIVSELKGNRVGRLFRIHTFSDGNAANEDVKISIVNIRPDLRRFDIQVRAYNDDDTRPVILEAYSNLTLVESDTNFIARRIGTTNGEYVLNSKYIMIELGANCQDESFPCGFEGYPVRDYECALSPKIFYKTRYESFDKVRKTYLGIGDAFGYDDDMFKYKGKPDVVGLPDWTGTTKGFHLDVNATGATVDNVGLIEFETGEAPFQNDNDLNGTSYQRLNARKFTVLPYGGFDGWDIHRERRTNTDTYDVNGIQGQKGLLSGAFEETAIEGINNGSTIITSDFYAYLRGLYTLADRNSIRINLLAFPNVNTTENSDLVEETIDFIEELRCDVFYIATTLDTNADSQVLTTDDVVSTIDGLFDSSYAGTYFPFIQYIDDENNRNVYIPPTAEVVRIMALTDKTSAPWFAAAGRNRAQLSTRIAQARIKLTEPQMGELYDNRVNPIATFRQANGTNAAYVWGQKTLQIEDSALTDINIRRLLIYLQRQIEDVGLDLLFEPNDEEIRRRFEEEVEPILSDVRDRRGVFDYNIAIDRSDAAFDSNELNVKVGIKPTRALEFVFVEFVLTKTGAEFSGF